MAFLLEQTASDPTLKCTFIQYEVSSVIGVLSDQVNTRQLLPKILKFKKKNSPRLGRNLGGHHTCVLAQLAGSIHNFTSLSNHIFGLWGGAKNPKKCKVKEKTNKSLILGFRAHFCVFSSFCGYVIRRYIVLY